MVTFGIMISSIIGFAVPHSTDPIYGFLWRVLMGFPIFASITQLLLLLFVFKSESPIFYKLKGNIDEEHDAIKLIYKDPNNAVKILSNEDSLMVSIRSMEYDHKLKVLDEPPRFIDLLKNPYRPAFIVGWIVAVLTQLNKKNIMIIRFFE